MKSRGGRLGAALGAAALLGGLAVSTLREPAPLPSPSASSEAAAFPAPEAGRAPADVEDAAKPPALPAAPTAELLLFLQRGADPKAYAAEHGLVHRYSLRSDPDAHVFGAGDVERARGHRGRARQDPRVRRAYLNERLDRVKWAWVPNDPYYPNNSPSAGFRGQWHLGNGAAPAADPRLPAAWARDVTGSGVIVGIVDDGLQTAHPDLSPNYLAAHSWDFGGNDGNPSPAATADNHGTSVAGVAAARGGNGIGGTGAAPLAGLAGLRINFAQQTTAMFVDATLYHSSGGDTSTKVKNHSYGYTLPYIESQAERDAAATSAAAGTIHLFAAGNERGFIGQDSNKQDVQSSPDVITVAALNSNGTFAPYSSFGANVFVTAPSNGVSGFAVTTTDRTGENGYNATGDSDAFPDLDYTSTFGGTSSATPLAAGVIALVKQVQPNLDVRFAKHLLARTCRKVDLNDATLTGGGDGTTPGSAWKTNAAGFSFNQNYGFGLIDADALTQQALLYVGVTPPQPPVTTGTVAVNASIPDTAAGVSRQFTIGTTTPVEWVQITLDVTHSRRGHIEPWLTSPSGTECRLALRSSESGSNINWTYSSNAFWGENPAGTWTLQLRDMIAGRPPGTWNSFAVSLSVGEAVLAASPVVESIVRAAASPTPAAAVQFAVTFNKSVTGVDAGDFALVAEGVTGASVTNVSGSGRFYTVTVGTGAGDGTLRLDVLDDGSIADLLGVPLDAPFDAGESYTIDRTSPTVLRVRSTTPDAAYGAGAAIDVTVDFSEAVTLSGGNLQVALSTGDVVTIGPFGSATSAAGTYTVGAGDNSPDLDSGSPLVLTGGTLQDAAGNNAVLTVPAGQNLASLEDLVIDTAAPSLVINQAAVQADPTNAGPILFTAVFSESVSGFDGGDVSFAGSTAGGTLAAAVSGAGTTWTVSVSGMSSTGLVVVSVPAGGAVDAAGNTNAASSSTDNQVLYDGTAPTASIEQAPGQADPTAAAPILFTVVFSEPVTGFETGDVTLSGSAGATTAVVTGSGTTYSVSVSGMASAGTVVASIAAGVAQDPAGNGNAASTSTDNQVAYDATAPAVTVNQAVGQGDPTSSSPILFSVVFSEAVTGFDDADVSLAGSTVGGTLAVSVSGSGSAYTISVTGMSGTGTVVASVPAGAAVDAVGNPSTASISTDNEVTFDAAIPAVVINQAAAQADPTAGASIVFDVLFSEPVNGFATGDISFAGSTAGGTLVGTVSGSSPGTAFTVTVTGMSSSGTVVATIPGGAAASASSGVPSAASTSTDNAVTYDVTPPAVTINQAAGQADPTNAPSIVFTVVFDEAVTGFGPEDVVLGGTAGATTADVSGDGTTYSVSVSGMAQGGTVTASVAAGGAVDAVGNANAASTSADNVVTYDVAPPAVTINQAAGQADPSNGSSIVFDVVFGEPVSGFATGDVSFAGSTVGGTLVGTVAGGPTAYTVTVTGMSGDGAVVASVPAGMALDAAGNPNAASTSTDNVVTRDATPPTVAINQASGQADPTNASPILFSVVFSEAVTGFGPADVVLGGTAGATTALVSGSGTTYTVSVSGMTGGGIVTAAVAADGASDAAGNANAASSSADNSVTYDLEGPTVTVNRAVGQADPTNGSSILFTVVFSEAVSGFETGDVTLGGSAGATTAVVSGGPTTYTVTVSGMTADGSVTASVGAGVAVDAAGNGNQASTSADDTVLFDDSGPTVTVEQAAGQEDPTNAAPILFTATFSEPVTGFAAGDVVVGGTAGGSASVSGGPSIYTISVTGLSGDGKVVVTVGADAAVDAAGNGNEASTSTDNSVTYDLGAPAVSAVSSTTPDGVYGPGDPITLTVAFSEPVVVTGTPQLTLETGAADATAAYSGGSGTDTLTFAYVVAAGHASADLDYASTGALAGTIADLAGNAAVLALPAPGAPGSLGANRDLVVDGTAPTAGTVSDGWSGPDLDVQLSTTTIRAHWSGFSDPESGIAGYEWAIGTTSGGQEVRAFAPVGLQTSASTSAVDVLLALARGTTYYVSVRATNGTGLTVTATSDGITVNGNDRSPPLPPAGFVALAGDRSVLLEWLPSGSGDVASYRIWWKEAAAPWTAASMIEGVTGTAATLLALVNGTAYDVMIKAVDTGENESAGVFASATPSAPFSIGGIGSYGSAQAALDAAAPGETVNLGPGTFIGDLVVPAGVSLEGTSPKHTIIEGTITVDGDYLTDPTSTISSLTITGGTLGVDAGTADVLLDHVILHHAASHGAASDVGGRLRAVHCTILSNGGDGLLAQGVASARNCIVGKNAGTGIAFPAAAAVDYNAVYANALADLAAGVSGTGNHAFAAKFVDEPGFDFRVQSASRTVDAGDPADGFAKEPAPNGGRANQGAFGNTFWAARTPSSSGGGGGGGGSCGALGLELLIPWALAGLLVRRRRV